MIDFPEKSHVIKIKDVPLQRQNQKAMNYEELLEAKAAEGAKKVKMPIGTYYKKQVDDKWVNAIDIRPQLNDNIVFAEALKKECEENGTLVHKHQLHFEPVTTGADITSLTVEKGSFVSMEQLLREQPAIVAQKSFIDNTVNDLLDLTSYLHEKGIWHVCYSPQNVFVRKGDQSVMLISHGSYYLGMSEPMSLYEGVEEYVAPEIRNAGTIDARCDIYSLGKFIDYLFEQADMPYEYKRVAKKAQNELPEGRYGTPEEMKNALVKKRGMYKSLLTFAAAVVVALIAVGLYFELMPQPTNVEYVKPAPKTDMDDLLDDGFDPMTELGVVSSDTSVVLTPEQAAHQKEYEAKAEQIFRKQYAEKADKILSKVYNNDNLSSSEKKFLSGLSDVNEELLRAQMELGEQAGLSDAKAQVIAAEIVETLTEQKKKGLNYYGIQK